MSQQVQQKPQQQTPSTTPVPAGHANLPLHYKIIAGGIAGSVETIITYPLDVLKTRQQISVESQSMLTISKNILKNEGPLTFYRGLSSPVIGEFIKRGVKFGCNEQYKQFFVDDRGHLSNWGASGAGALAGMTEACVNCPFEVVKVRMQAKENKGVFSSTIDCAMQLMKKEGIRGLYQGFEAQLWRNTIWNGTYFGIIGSIKNMFPQSDKSSKREVMLQSLGAGFIGGALASIANISFDTAKSRIQSQLPGTKRQFNWAIPTIIYIARNEGVKACFKGLPAKLLRLSPGGAILSLVFDLVIEQMQKFKKTPRSTI